MTVRTITEITDRDDDTITTIAVGVLGSDYVEIVVGQWSTGERDPSTDRRVALELDDARALRDALAAAVRDIEAMPAEDVEEEP